MPRPPRLLLSHSYYHIIIRGNNRHEVFKFEGDYQYFLALIARFKKDLHFDLYHYSLMPNHIHILIKTLDADNFSLFMKKLELAYFHYYRQHYGWVGHFWQGRFKSQPVGKDAYFIQCGKYIEINSVRAGIVDKPEDYSYSSYRYYTLGQADPLLTEDFLYGNLSQEKVLRQGLYRNLVIDDIVKENYTKKVWGSRVQTNIEKVKINYHSK